MEHNRSTELDQIQEMDDLVSGLADGRVLISIISLYKENITYSNNSKDNFTLIKNKCSKWNDIIIPWLSSELTCSAIQLKGVLMTFLINLFKKFENHHPNIHRKQ
jgi:hypothetical protein